MPLAPPQSCHPHLKKQQTARSRSSLTHGSWQCSDTRPATAAARSRMCREKCKETREEALQSAIDCKSNTFFCMFIKLHTFGQKSSFLLTQSIHRRSLCLRAVQSRCPHGSQPCRTRRRIQRQSRYVST